MSTRSYIRYDRSRAGATALRASRRGWLRRFTTGLVAFAFIGFSAETLIADVHDGDATVAEADALGVHLEASNVSTENLNKDRDVPGDGAPRGHSAHACHCVHAHGGVVEASTITSTPRVSSVMMRGISDLLPPSLSQEPRLRPPNA